MAGFTKDMGAVAIKRDLAKALKENIAGILMLASDDRMFAEAKVRNRLALLRKGDAIINEARVAFEEWAKVAEGDARRRIATDPVGSAAEESRRVANELRLSRLIESSRSLDAAAGPKVIDGKVIANPSALDLAERAQKAYLDSSDYAEAAILAEASVALGGPETAQRVLAASRQMMESPAQRAARAELASIARERMEFERDLNGIVSATFQASAMVSEAVGLSDEVTALNRNAAAASLTAKTLALAIANETGTSYIEPEGVLAGAAVGTPMRPTDGEIDRRMTHNLDTGAVYMEDAR